MPGLKPQTRFLLRGSALLVGLLTLWWFALLTPMLYLLKGAAGTFIRIEDTAAGDWTLRVPLEMTLPATPQQPVAQQVHSIDFDMPRTDAIAFTFSLPVFWALVLAAPGVRRNLRPMLAGTALMAAVEVALLLAYAEVSARKAVAQLAAAAPGAGETWLLHFGEYLTVTVLPYAAPLVIAFAMNRDLRWLVFRWGCDPDVAAEPVRPRAGKKQGRP